MLFRSRTLNWLLHTSSINRNNSCASVLVRPCRVSHSSSFPLIEQRCVDSDADSNRSMSTRMIVQRNEEILSDTMCNSDEMLDEHLYKSVSERALLSLSPPTLSSVFIASWNMVNMTCHNRWTDVLVRTSSKRCDQDLLKLGFLERKRPTVITVLSLDENPTMVKRFYFIPLSLSFVVAHYIVPIIMKSFSSL